MTNSTTTRGRAVRALLAGLTITTLALSGSSSEAATERQSVVTGVETVDANGRFEDSRRKAKKVKKAPRKSVRPAQPAPAAAATSGTYAFMKLENGSPVRYNPCRTIQYVVNGAQAPAGGVNDVHAAFARIAEATGLSFSNAGTTDEIATPDRGTRANPRYAGRFEPILVGFHRPGETPLLNGSNVGAGGSIWHSNEAGRSVLVTGVVAIDAAQAAQSPTGFAGPHSLGVLLLHEIAHVVGLAHVDSRSEIMFPTRMDGTATTLGAGDRSGLAQLGARAGCVADPVYPF